jgi:hypothetical protein
MRNRAVFKKAACHPAVAGLSLQQLQTIEPMQLAGLAELAAQEKREFIGYAENIKRLLAAERVCQQRQARLDAIVGQLRAGGLVIAEGLCNTDGSLTIWPEGKPKE